MIENRTIIQIRAHLQKAIEATDNNLLITQMTP